MRRRPGTDEYDTDYVPVNASGSAEPFTKPDYKAKRHGRPTPKMRTRGRNRRPLRSNDWNAMTGDAA